MKSTGYPTELLPKVESLVKKLNKIKQHYKKVTEAINQCCFDFTDVSERIDDLDMPIEKVGLSEQITTILKRTNVNTLGEALITSAQYDNPNIPKKEYADKVILYLRNNNISVDNKVLLDYVDEYFKKAVQSTIQGCMDSL